MGAIAFDRTRFGTGDKTEFVQDCVSLTRPITSRQGLAGTLWITFLHGLGTHLFTKPAEEAELSAHALVSPKAEPGWVLGGVTNRHIRRGCWLVFTACSGSLQLVSALLLLF